MTVLATELFDAGGEGASVTESSPWTLSAAAGYTPATYAAAAAMHGTRGARFSSVDHFQFLKWTNGSGMPVLTASFYFNLRTLPGAILFLCQINDAANAKLCDFRVNAASGGASTVTIRNVNTAVATSSQTIVANTYYRVEYTVTAASSSQELKLFTGESTSTLIDLTGATNGNQPMLADIGVVAASSSGGAFDLDTVRIADAANLGPYVSVQPYKAKYKTGGGTQQVSLLNRVL